MKLLLILPLLTASMVATAAEPAPPARSEHARRGLEISSVASRDSRQRPETVLDNGNREFRYTYDTNGRVESLKATRGAHISDIVAVQYDDENRLAFVRLQGGYELHFQYLADGQQVVRDRFGGLIGRLGSPDSGYTVVQQSDPSGRLAQSLRALDRALALASRTEPASRGTP